MTRRRPRRWRHWTLRSRLAVVTAALTALALLGANAAGVILLRSYLVDRVDQQLTLSGTGAGQRERLVSAIVAGTATAPTGERTGGQFLSEALGGDSRMLVYDATGLRGTYPTPPEAPGPDLPPVSELAERTGGPFTVTSPDGATSWRVAVSAVGPVAGLAEGGFVVVTTSFAQIDATTERLVLIDAVVTAAALAVLGAAAALLVRVGLRPLTRMAATAGAIAAGDLTRRVADTDPHTEPGRLGGAMNAMLGRVEAEITARAASEQRLRRFLADASHELRTPLTSIRGFAELYRRGGDGADALRRIEAEAARMGVLVEDLLLLARLDEQRTPERRPVDLLELSLDVVRDLRARAPRRTVRVQSLDAADGLIEPLVVVGDPLRLRQVLGNLVANADRHTPPEATITVRLGPALPDALGAAVSAAGAQPPPERTAAVVEVVDTGAGVPAEHAPHVFERLYRADPARSGGGAGLGLAIAAALAESHGGRVELAARRPPGGGAVFRVVLPLPLPLPLPPSA
ncbi:sensor histidine kinase [Streptomyces formicae]|uniref:sensor histidine kinase n=1 Tax=Streptomyces formicae TaxID=1616117 RepID=UPI001F5AD304|nr:ATP-binding protein [Streptomyces formicae]